MTAPWEDIRLSEDLNPASTHPYAQPSQRQGEPSRPAHPPTSQPTSPLTPSTASRALSAPLIPTARHTDTFPLEAINRVPPHCLQDNDPLQVSALPPRNSLLHGTPSRLPRDPNDSSEPHAPPDNAMMDLSDLFELSHNPPTRDGSDLIKMFGPEQVVQDPTLRAYYESIIRDILICMIICTSTWVVLCLAVPVAGL